MKEKFTKCRQLLVAQGKEILNKQVNKDQRPTVDKKVSDVVCKLAGRKECEARF
jgi:hypothetical protein